MTARAPIAVYHEHPDWFRPLFAELERRDLPYLRIDAAAHWYDASASNAPYALVVNRASPSAYVRGHAAATHHTLHWLRHLERVGVPVVNGSAAYALELSKATQLSLLQQLGLPHPRTRIVNAASKVRDAALGLRYPILFKANVGGSGAGIVRFDSASALRDAVDRGALDFGPDGTALLQELIPLRNGHITRVETLGGKFLYAINVYPAVNSFDLCPADACEKAPRGARHAGGDSLDPGGGPVASTCAADAESRGLLVEAYTPPPAIIEAVEHIAQAAHLDVGGIEYVTDERDGQHYFYDINALSNFVADAVNVVGFDPWVPLVDYLVSRATDSKTAVAATHDADRHPRYDTRRATPSPRHATPSCA